MGRRRRWRSLSRSKDKSSRSRHCRRERSPKTAAPLSGSYILNINGRECLVPLAIRDDHVKEVVTEAFGKLNRRHRRGWIEHHCRCAARRCKEGQWIVAGGAARAAQIEVQQMNYGLASGGSADYY